MTWQRTTAEVQQPRAIQRRVTVSGQVQGVFFRDSTRQRAKELGLVGWVRNRYDGSVEAVFQGPPQAVAEMLEWCHQGPSGAHVSEVEVVDEEPDHSFPGFSVRGTE
jgi:acylphosphatase